ncbi:hypothetical protein SAY87_018049 [Trapa incisa]|uniref:Uncharacterized protein n=1 Tax=Trapa incisa TaxID=236973 RepID=A0AAN7LBF1_9MYRT|nr:hypothetical protein SAY87_018049 [Trapa incisa]
MKNEGASRGTNLLRIAVVESENRGRWIWRGLLGDRRTEEDDETADRNSMAGRIDQITRRILMKDEPRRRRKEEYGQARRRSGEGGGKRNLAS